jgi:hypothetical protein
MYEDFKNRKKNRSYEQLYYMFWIWFWCAIFFALSIDLNLFWSHAKYICLKYIIKIVLFLYILIVAKCIC